jgi:hypothetical protein
MAEALNISFIPRKKSPNLLAAEIAGAQWGVIGGRQLAACQVAGATASRWRANGRLHALYTGVFALGHRSVPIEGRMVAALLRVEGAVLSHATAAWWWGLIDTYPGVIELSIATRIRAPDGLVVHQRRRFESTRHRRFPITTLRQTFLDLAATKPFATVREALARADYLKLLDTHTVAAITGRGKPGSAALCEALRRHQPELAYTRSGLEKGFLALCEGAGLPLPEVNVRLHGWTVDALWRRERVVVELDGYDNHRTRSQIERDRRKDLALRAAGFIVLRYTWGQVFEGPALVIDDLAAALNARARGGV